MVDVGGPRRVVLGQGFRRLAPAARDSRTGGQSFQAVAMVRAGAGKCRRGETVGGQCLILRNPDMPHFRVAQPVERLAVQTQSSANASANR